MHELTRRRWCRAAFFALCLVPTCFTAGWGVWAESSLCRERLRREWQVALSQHLGLPVEIRAAVRGPAGSVRLDGVQIVDPERHLTLAAVRHLSIEQDGPGWRILASAPRIEQAELRTLLAAWHEHGLRRAGERPVPFTWFASDVTLDSPRGAATLSEIHGTWESTDLGPQLAAEMTLASGTPGAQLKLSVARDRRADPARTTWRLETLDQPIPVTLLPDAFPELLALGDRCEFHGAIEMTQAERGWSGVVSGQWREVDLDRWTERLPHKLSGLADVELRRARLDDGRLVEAEGLLTSRGGVVSRSFLLTTGDENVLALRVASRVPLSQDVLWRYQQLAVEFVLTRDGLQLSGRCEGLPPGTLMADSRGPLLQDSTQAVVPAVALVRSLAPASQVLVPAGVETDSLLRVLPLPELSTPANVADQPRSPRVRLQ